MDKDEKSTFPGSLRDHHDAVKAEAEEVSIKINEALGKLAKKMRERADKPKRRWTGPGSPRSGLSCCAASSCMRMRRPISKNACPDAAGRAP